MSSPSRPSADLNAAPKHIVDVLIEERAPQLAGSTFWPLVRAPLYGALGYARARRMADAIAPLGGRAALDHLSAILRLRTDCRGLERIPLHGRCVLVSNHPTGIADGIALYDALKPVRPDVIFFANADAERVCPRFDEALIAVEWVAAKRTIEKTKKTLRAAQAAFAEERPLAIFPAGRLARRIEGRMQDPSWEPSAVSLARKHRAPLVPVWMDGPYSTLFHSFDRVSKELRDMTLFHELLNKEGKLFTIRVGRPIAPEALVGDSEEVTRRLKSFVEHTLRADPDATFEPAPAPAVLDRGAA
jgi:putative hemolysin